MKELGFRGASLEDLKKFNHEIIQQIGYNLHRVQMGKMPNDSKMMRSIGVGVREIRAKDKDGIYRAIYVANFSDTVYVLHCFQKKETKTRKQDIDLARKRLNKLIQEKKDVRNV